MFTPLPELPVLNWFEIETLYYLRDQERYGNELLAMFKDHVGEGSVTSGKLYSDLKNMEKKGYIHKIKKKKKNKEGKKTRGVERIYFTITTDGKEALIKCERYMSSWMFASMLKRSSEDIPGIIDRILSPLGSNIKVGVAVESSKLGIARAMDLLPDIDGIKFVLLLISGNDDREQALILDTKANEMASFPSNDDDIPLRDGYLDAVISIYPLTRAKKEGTYIKELIRVIGKNGKVIIIDFSKLDSFILEDIFSSQMEWSEKDLRGHDSRGILELLTGSLEKVEVKRFKEQYIAWGSKKK